MQTGGYAYNMVSCCFLASGEAVSSPAVSIKSTTDSPAKSSDQRPSRGKRTGPSTNEETHTSDSEPNDISESEGEEPTVRSSRGPRRRGPKRTKKAKKDPKKKIEEEDGEAHLETKKAEVKDEPIKQEVDANGETGRERKEGEGVVVVTSTQSRPPQPKSPTRKELVVMQRRQLLQRLDHYDLSDHTNLGTCKFTSVLCGASFGSPLGGWGVPMWKNQPIPRRPHPR